MPIKIEIPESSLTYFSTEAKNELHSHLDKHAQEIIKEAGRIEESLKEDNSTPEITRQIIKQAVYSYKNTTLKRKMAKRTIVIRVIATLGMAISGYLCDLDNMKQSTVLLVLFLIFAIAGTASSIYVIFGGEGN